MATLTASRLGRRGEKRQARVVQKKATRSFSGTDSLEDYADPKQTKLSLERALKDLKRGRLSTKL